MCGRFVQSKPMSLYAELLGVEVDNAVGREPTFNLAPSLPALAFRVSDGKVVASLPRWGLSPFWAKPGGQKPINARLETAATSGFFRKPWKNGRCIVPADGWYEWQKTANGKQPYFFERSDDQPIFLAGLLEDETFALITMAAVESLSGVHDRRPYALTAAAALAWLEPGSQPEAAPESDFHFRTVSRKVNRADNDGPELLD